MAVLQRSHHLVQVAEQGCQVGLEVVQRRVLQEAIV